MKTTEKRYWHGHIGPNDDFGNPIVDIFIDGKTIYGKWAVMSLLSWNMFGIGRLSTGCGQKYQKQEDGRWLCIEG